MRIDDLTHDDVETYVRVHLVLLEATYAHLADPAFAVQRWSEQEGRIAETHADLDRRDEALAAGTTPPRRHLVARSDRGTMVGVACTATEIGEWEQPLLGEAWVAPATTTSLAFLYTAPGTHGTGLGQHLLDAALPDRAPAHLWVMTDNVRAVAFYRRNGFVPDLGPFNSGETWGQLPMMRMARG